MPLDHEEILRYAKTPKAVYNPVRQPPDSSSYRQSDGRGPYRLLDVTAAGERRSLQYQWRGFTPPSGRSWRFSLERLEQYFSDERIVISGSAMPRIKRYFDESIGTEIGSVWDDISSFSSREAAFPKAKPPALCNRIIQQATDEGDWVLNPLCGSGQLLIQAQKLNRSWVGCDESVEAIRVTRELFEREFDSSSGPVVVVIDNATLRNVQPVCTTYRDIFLTNQELDSAKIKLSKLVELSGALKNELADDNRDEEEFLEALQAIIPRLKWLVSEEPKQLCLNSLTQRLPEFELLEGDSQDFLITSSVILDVLPDSMDFSVASVSAWKAIESELYAKLLRPFRDSVLMIHGNPVPFTASDLQKIDMAAGKGHEDWERKELARYLRSDKAPGLGQTLKILTKCATSRRTIKESPSLKALLDFVRENFVTPDFLLTTDGICSVLKQEEINRYRNGAAHKTLMSKDRATESLDFVLNALTRICHGLCAVKRSDVPSPGTSKAET